ncbi:hypothetical protein MRX96_059354 [Rhipicephalus microplus]
MTMATLRVQHGRLIVAMELQSLEKQKKVALKQYMKALSKKKLPDVIALQETYDHAKFPGYVTPCPFSESTGRNITMCILLRRETAYVEHELDVVSDIGNSLIESTPSKDIAGLFGLNV